MRCAEATQQTVNAMGGSLHALSQATVASNEFRIGTSPTVGRINSERERDKKLVERVVFDSKSIALFR